MAERYKQHDWYLSIITEDVKDFRAALDYISDLEFDDADSLMKKYGNVLMQNIPAETTQFLKSTSFNFIINILERAHHNIFEYDFRFMYRL